MVPGLKVLITGASGLVGSKLLESATRAGHDTIAICNQHDARSPKVYRLDLRNQDDLRKVLRHVSPDVVVHSAAMTDVDLCERDARMAFLINASTTQVLAEECANGGCHLVYVSTDYVFDGQRGNYKETDPANPINAYGKSKVAGEEAVQGASPSFCVARTSVVYGWGREFRPNFAGRIYKELKAGRAVKVVNDQYASPTLNSQLARMLLEVAEKRVQGIIHLAGAARLSRYEFAHEMARIFKMPAELVIPTNADSSSWIAKRPRDSSLNVEKATKLLANKPATLKDSLTEFAEEAE